MRGTRQARTRFLLDSSNICFICLLPPKEKDSSLSVESDLEDNPNPNYKVDIDSEPESPENTPRGKRKKSIGNVKSKNKYLCKNISKSQGSLFALTPIAQCMEVDQGKMISMSVCMDPKSLRFLRESEVVVWVCQECGKITKRFAQLYEKTPLNHKVVFRLGWDEPDPSFRLTLAKLRRINKCIREIGLKMMEADSHPVRLQRTRRKLDLVSACLLINLRMEILEKCRIFVKSLIPEVVIKTSVPEPEPEMKHTPCQYCRDILPSREDWELHVTQIHCERFFPDSKAEFVTSTQFQQILVDHLFTDFITYDELGSFCNLCGKLANNPRARDGDPEGKSEMQMKRKKQFFILVLKLHLLKRHRTQLLEKLEKIQKILGGKLEPLQFKWNSNGIHCPCGVYLPEGERAMAAHEIHQCKLLQPIEEAYCSVSMTSDNEKDSDSELNSRSIAVPIPPTQAKNGQIIFDLVEAKCAVCGLSLGYHEWKQHKIICAEKSNQIVI